MEPTPSACRWPEYARALRRRAAGTASGRSDPSTVTAPTVSARCPICSGAIEPTDSARLVFRPDGRVEHGRCPDPVCPWCLQAVAPSQPRLRSGRDIFHRDCLRASRSERLISGGSAASPWTAIFDEQCGRQAHRDRRAFAEFQAVTREAVEYAIGVRALARSVRSRLRGEATSPVGCPSLLEPRQAARTPPPPTSRLPRPLRALVSVDRASPVADRLLAGDPRPWASRLQRWWPGRASGNAHQDATAYAHRRRCAEAGRAGMPVGMAVSPAAPVRRLRRPHHQGSDRGRDHHARRRRADSAMGTVTSPKLMELFQSARVMMYLLVRPATALARRTAGRR